MFQLYLCKWLPSALSKERHYVTFKERLCEHTHLLALTWHGAIWNYSKKELAVRDDGKQEMDSTEGEKLWYHCIHSTPD